MNLKMPSIFIVGGGGFRWNGWTEEGGKTLPIFIAHPNVLLPQFLYFVVVSSPRPTQHGNSIKKRKNLLTKRKKRGKIIQPTIKSSAGILFFRRFVIIKK
jgi:hypothetical protein